MRDATDRDTASAFCMVEAATIRENDDPELLRLLRVANSALQEVRNLGWERYNARHDQRPVLEMARSTIDDGLRVLEYRGRRATARLWRARGRQLAVARKHGGSPERAGDVLHEVSRMRAKRRDSQRATTRSGGAADGRRLHGRSDRAASDGRAPCHWRAGSRHLPGRRSASTTASQLAPATS